MSIPFITLFNLVSVDGKISTGSVDYRDFDKDLPNLPEIASGLQQYYDIERTTDSWTIGSGKTFEKLGFCTDDYSGKQLDSVNLLVYDNKSLNLTGIRNLCRKFSKVVLATHRSTESLSQLGMFPPNCYVLQYDCGNLRQSLEKVQTLYGIERMTLQVGGTLNAEFLREGLVKRVHVVVAPVLIGGQLTPTLMDGMGIMTDSEVQSMSRSLKLKSLQVLSNSYLSIMYDVINEEVHDE